MRLRLPEGRVGFLLRLALALLLAQLLWRLWLEPWALKLLWLASDLCWPDWMPQGLKRLDPLEQAWRVHTGWPIVSAPGEAGGEQAIFFFALSRVEGPLATLPWLMALLAASLCRSPSRWLLGLALALLLAWLSATASAWHEAVQMLSAQPGPLNPLFQLPPFRLALPAPAAWQMGASAYASFLLALLDPLLLPLLLWACLCPQQVRALAPKRGGPKAQR
jgi:hypothetical protein